MKATKHRLVREHSAKAKFFKWNRPIAKQWLGDQKSNGENQTLSLRPLHASHHGCETFWRAARMQLKDRMARLTKACLCKGLVLTAVKWLVCRKLHRQQVQRTLLARLTIKVSCNSLAPAVLAPCGPCKSCYNDFRNIAGSQ